MASKSQADVDMDEDLAFDFEKVTADKTSTEKTVEDKGSCLFVADFQSKETPKLSSKPKLFKLPSNPLKKALKTMRERAKKSLFDNGALSSSEKEDSRHKEVPSIESFSSQLALVPSLKTLFIFELSETVTLRFALEGKVLCNTVFGTLEIVNLNSLDIQYSCDNCKGGNVSRQLSNPFCFTCGKLVSIVKTPVLQAKLIAQAGKDVIVTFQGVIVDDVLGLSQPFMQLYEPCRFESLFGNVEESLSNPMHDVGSVHDTKAKGKAATENPLNAMPAAIDTVKASQQRGASASASASRETLKANNIEDPQEDGDNIPAATEIVKTSLQTMASASASALRKSLKTNSTEDLQEVGVNMPAATETTMPSASASASALRESLKTNSIEDLQEVGDNTPAANEIVKTSLQTMASASASASASRESVKANNIEDLQEVGDNSPLEGFLRKAKAKRKVGLEEVPEETASTGCGSPKKMEDKAESTKVVKENLRRMQMEADLEAERAAKDRLERERKEKEQQMEDDLAYEREEKAELERERKEKVQQRGDLEEERKEKVEEKEKAEDKEKAEKKETVAKRGLYKRPMRGKYF
ncbi:hypothetical protein L7F22_068778 [Adiantum nelumboides]|nr:hypothetical protein [Adiantum nelumboides]